MRTLIDISEAEIEMLDRLAKEGGVSRASVIREALRQFLRDKAVHKQAEAFGLWGDQIVDGLQYQEEIRSEW